ncbi:MAG: TetR/AcrR family transcriptional regulator [Microthrixaceae bacterium]
MRVVGRRDTNTMYSALIRSVGGVVATEPRAGRPRDARLDAAIVDATVELLEERGYSGLSLVAVADRAETTTAAIYRRWASKSELVAHAVFRTDGDDVVADSGDLAADLATMVRWSVDKIYRPAALSAIAGLLSEPRADRRERASDAASASRLVTERLERAKAAGELRADVDTSVLTALIDGPVLHAVLSGSTGVDDTWISELVRVVLDGARPAPTSRRRSSARSRTRTAPNEVTPR